MEENIKPSEISKVLLEELRQVDLSAKTEEVGEVLTASDGVVRIWGLNSAEAGELLEFENGEKAVVMNLEVDNVGAVLLGSTDTVKEGDVVEQGEVIALMGCTGVASGNHVHFEFHPGGGEADDPMDYLPECPFPYLKC
jgi:F-type H+-transporting ATPase subunit alpha